MGSCVDNSRAVALAVAVANKLGVDTDKVRDLTGGYFIVDLDPESAGDKLLEAIDLRSKGQGL